MKLIIAGSRTLTVDIAEIYALCNHFNLQPTEIVSGTAKGIDSCGEDFAKFANLKLKQFPADWDFYGKKAGYIRNYQMAEYADVLLLIWDGKSLGSASMKRLMELYKKPIHAVVVKS